MGLAYNENDNENEWREFWGVKFKWTPEHLTSADLEPLTHSYDTVATEAVERLDEVLPPIKVQIPKDNNDVPVATVGGKRVKRDLYELLKQHANTDEKIGRLWSEVNTIPDWVDWEQIERGQKVFYRYGIPVIISVSEPDVVSEPNGLITRF